MSFLKKPVITRHFVSQRVIVQFKNCRAKKTRKMASALGNLMANYTDSEGEEMAEGGSEGEGEGNPSLADR